MQGLLFLSLLLLPLPLSLSVPPLSLLFLRLCKTIPSMYLAELPFLHRSANITLSAVIALDHMMFKQCIIANMQQQHKSHRTHAIVVMMIMIVMTALHNVNWLLQGVQIKPRRRRINLKSKPSAHHLMRWRVMLQSQAQLLTAQTLIDCWRQLLPEE